MAFHPRPVGPSITNNAAPFSVEMTQGSLPPRNRQFIAGTLRMGNQLSQTTHVPAPETEPMHTVTRPERPRLMSTRNQQGQQLSQLTPVTTFSPEMVVGYHPDRAQLWLPLKTGWSVSQTTFVAAPFSVEMAQGSRPDRSRAFVPPKLGWIVAQTSFDQAPFSPEMVAGWIPVRSRAFIPPKLGLQVAQTSFDQAPASVEMTQGAVSNRSVLWLPVRSTWILYPPDSAVFSPEMVQGSFPLQNRVLLGSRIGQPVSQPTFDAAPFSPEMVQGSIPTSPRLLKGNQSGVWLAPTDTLIPIVIIVLEDKIHLGTKESLGVTGVPTIGGWNPW